MHYAAAWHRLFVWFLPHAVLLEALATAISAFVLVSGFLIALRYGHRADGSVAGLVMPAKSGVVVTAILSITSKGIRRLRISADDGASPLLVITEVIVSSGQLSDGRQWKVSDSVNGEKLFADTLLDPNEVLVSAEPFYMDTPADDLAAWRLDFSFAVRRYRRRFLIVGKRRYWYWDARTFVSVGNPVQ